MLTWHRCVGKTAKMSSNQGALATGSDVTILITRVHVHPLCALVEFWGKFTKERNVEYECLAKNIQSVGKTFKEFEGGPGDQCLVQVDGIWNRARIVSRNGSKYSVFLFDKGLTCSTSTSNIAWGKNEHFHLPPEVEFCVLANVLPLSTCSRWSPVALEFLKTLSGQSVQAHVQDVLMPHRTFILHIPCIAKQMYEMGFAKKMSPDMFQDFVLLSLKSSSVAQVTPPTQLMSMEVDTQLHKHEPFMVPEIPAGMVETVIVTEVTSPQRIFCQLKVFSQELKKQSEKITQCCEGRITNSTVGPGMIGLPCAARAIDGRWYRSVLQQVFPNNGVVEVLHIDYGTKHLVQLDNVRPLPLEFLRMPVVTYICSLHGIIDRGVGWTTGQIDFLRNLLLCKTVIAKFEYQSMSEGVHYVTLYSDNNTNINSLFGSKESCLLKYEDSETLHDFALHVPAYSHEDQARQEKRKMLTSGMTEEEEDRKPGRIGQENEYKVLRKVNTLPAEDLLVNSTHAAVVLHVTNPSEFWIQTQNYSKELDELMDSLYHLCKEPENKDVVVNPTVGMYCVAKAEDGDFYRATVCEIGETHLKVFFVDFGTSEFVECSDVRTLPEKLKKLPRLALKCSLAGVGPKDGRWSQTASDFFTKAVAGKVLNVHVTAKYDEQFDVQLMDREAQQEKDFGTLMCTANLAKKAETLRQSKATKSMQSVPPPHRPHVRFSDVHGSKEMSFQSTATTAIRERKVLTFKEHVFPIGSVLDVSVSYIDSPNDFWCQLVQNAGHLKLLMHEIQAHYADSEFEPFVEVACIARHPDNRMWYRVIVIHKHERPLVDVLFVDYGQTETISLYELRKITSGFLTLPGQAFRCSLLNPVDPTSAINEWSDDATARLLDFVENAATNFTILKCTIYAVMYNFQKIVFNIVNLETPFESICTSLVNLVKSPPSNISGPSFWLDSYYYSTHNVKTGTEEAMTVTCVNSVDQFYCHLERNTDVMEGLNRKVSKLCSQLEDVKLPSVFGTLCFAKYTDGHWYRGQIKTTKPAILVHFVDYGDTLEVDRSDLLPVPKEANDIMSVPVQAVVCGLSDVPTNVPKEVDSWFKTFASESRFQTLVVAREPDGKLLVELYSGNTQINSRIKKRFQLEMSSTEHDVYRYRNPLEPSVKHEWMPPKEYTKQPTEMDEKIQAAKSSFSSPKPAHQSIDETKPINISPQSAAKASRHACENGHRVRAVPLQLYKPPHQRQSCEIRPSNMGKESELASVYVAPRKELKTEALPRDSKKGCCDNVKQPSKLTDLPSKRITPGMEAEVYVSHCNSPLSFYVQLVSEEDEIFSLSEKLNDPASNKTTNITTEVHLGDLVQLQFEDDSLWYRAVVQELKSNSTALVEFIDFGNTAVTPISKMGRLHESLFQLPVYSTHCMLNDVAAHGEGAVLDQGVLLTFKEAVCGDGEKKLTCRFIRQSGSVWEVTLEDGGVNIMCKVPSTKCLVNSSESTTKELEQVEGKPVQDTEYPPLNPSLHYCQQELIEEQQLKCYITTINDDHSFWCQRADTEELDQITSGVSEVGNAADKGINSDLLSVGSPCVVLFSDDNLWYRAEVVDKSGHELSIFFVDYGNKSQVTITDVREIPAHLVKPPPQAFLCELEGFDSPEEAWASDALDEFSALTIDKLLLLTVTRVSKDEGNLKYLVQLECDGQMMNEVMKTWWKSPGTENESDTGELTISSGLPLQCEAVTAETALRVEQPEHPKTQELDTSEEHLNKNIVDSSVEFLENGIQTSPECFMVTGDERSEALEEVNIMPSALSSQTAAKDMSLSECGTEETLLLPERDILTMSFNEVNVGEITQGFEEENVSLVDIGKSDDYKSPLDEDLKEDADKAEMPLIDLEQSAEEKTYSIGSSSHNTLYFDDRDDDNVATAGDRSLTSKTTVKMVPREVLFPEKSVTPLKPMHMISEDMEQIQTEVVLPSPVLSEQQLQDDICGQGVEADSGASEKCDAVAPETDLMTWDDVWTPHEETDVGTTVPQTAVVNITDELENSEQKVRLPDAQKEDLAEAPSDEAPSTDDSFGMQLSKVTHLTLIINDGSADVDP